YYKSGKSFFYRHLPFWLASLVNRLLAVVVPLVVVLIPGLRTIPALFRWRIKLRLYRWYRALLLVERDLIVEPAGKRDELLHRLDDIERAANKMKVPASFADQFYLCLARTHQFRAGAAEQCSTSLGERWCRSLAGPLGVRQIHQQHHRSVNLVLVGAIGAQSQGIPMPGAVLNLAIQRSQFFHHLVQEMIQVRGQDG